MDAHVVPHKHVTRPEPRNSTRGAIPDIGCIHAISCLYLLCVRLELPAAVERMTAKSISMEPGLSQGRTRTPPGIARTELPAPFICESIIEGLSP